ncbi:MAG: O-antigen ligase family protein [Candidatus Cloacimonetes bacterium]|nr:O-antigen ligase family protein [Candidatus Cloacimonadota bacterium]
MPEFLLLLIGLGPFLYSGLTLETDNLRQFFFALSLIVCLSGGIPRSTHPNATNRLSLWDILIILFLIIRILTAKWGTEYFWYSLPTLINECLLGITYFLIRIHPPKARDLVFMSLGLLISITLVNLGQYIKPEFFKPVLQGRYSAQFFHPNLQGIYACACLCILWDFKPKTRGIFTLALVLTIISVYLCQSRTAFLGLTLVLIGYSSNKVRAGLVLLLPLILGLWFYNSGDMMEKFRMNFSIAFEIKWSVYESTGAAIKANPLGLGTGLFPERINAYLSDSFHYWLPNPAQNSLHNAHNSILHYVCESGWIMLTCIFLAGYLILQKFRENGSFVLILFVLTALFDVHLQQFTSQLFFILLLAIYQDKPLNLNLLSTFQTFLLPLILILCISAPLILHQQIYARFLKSALVSSKSINDLQTYREILNFNPWPLPSLKVEYLKLGSLIEEGSYNHALDLGMRLNQLFPGYYLLEHMIGRLYLLKGKPESALIWAEKAIDLHPMEEDNYLLLSEAYSALDESKKASDALELYLKLAHRNKNFRDQHINSEKTD